MGANEDGHRAADRAAQAPLRLPAGTAKRPGRRAIPTSARSRRRPARRRCRTPRARRRRRARRRFGAVLARDHRCSAALPRCGLLAVASAAGAAARLLLHGRCLGAVRALGVDGVGDGLGGLIAVLGGGDLGLGLRLRRRASAPASRRLEPATGGRGDAASRPPSAALTVFARPRARLPRRLHRRAGRLLLPVAAAARAAARLLLRGRCPSAAGSPRRRSPPPARPRARRRRRSSPPRARPVRRPAPEACLGRFRHPPVELVSSASVSAAFFARLGARVGFSASLSNVIGSAGFAAV